MGIDHLLYITQKQRRNKTEVFGIIDLRTVYMIHKNLTAETLSPHSRAQGMTNYTVCGARELNCMGKVCVTPNNSLQKVSVIMVLATKLSRSLATKNRKFP